MKRTGPLAGVCGAAAGVMALLVAVSTPAPANAVTCDGTELLCLDLTTSGEATANGGVVVGGSFNGAGFQPTNGGGLDFGFGPEIDLSTGSIEFDIEGLQPLAGGEQSGGKVSLFSVCGVAPDDNEYIGFQKMSPDYRDGHIFRYGQDDDGLADNWDAVIITGSGFGCFYSIASPPWQAGGVHHIEAAWSPSGLDLWIDGVNPCGNPNSGSGNGDGFDPATSFLVVGNRCTHLPGQQPVARIRDLRLWGSLGESEPPGPCDDGPEIEGVSLATSGAAGAAATFSARYRNCRGAAAFRVVQLWVGNEVAAGVPHVHAGYGEGGFSLGGENCAPGDQRELTAEYAALDCAASTVTATGDDLLVEYVLSFDVETFAGERAVFFDAKGGPGDPEPRLGWTRMGSFTVEPEVVEADDDDVATDDDDATSEPPEMTPADEVPRSQVPPTCACQGFDASPLLAVALIPLGRRRHR